MICLLGVCTNVDDTGNAFEMVNTPKDSRTKKFGYLNKENQTFNASNVCSMTLRVLIYYFTSMNLFYSYCNETSPTSRPAGRIP